MLQPYLGRVAAGTVIGAQTIDRYLPSIYRQLMAKGVFRIRRRGVKTYGPGPTLTPWEYEVFEPWYEIDVDGSWTSSYRLAIQQGRPVVAELRVFPTQDRHEDDVNYEAGEWSVEWDGPNAAVPEGGLTGTLLRKVPFEVLDALPGIVEWIKEHHPEDIEFLRGSGLAAQELKERRPGPKGPNDEELVEYALEYLDLTEAGHRNPHTLLARKHNHSDHRSKHLIHTARERSLLSSPLPGRAGGMLLHRGEKVLKRMKKNGWRPKK